MEALHLLVGRRSVIQVLVLDIWFERVDYKGRANRSARNQSEGKRPSPVLEEGGSRVLRRGQDGPSQVGGRVPNELAVIAGSNSRISTTRRGAISPEHHIHLHLHHNHQVRGAQDSHQSVH